MYFPIFAVLHGNKWGKHKKYNYLLLKNQTDTLHGNNASFDVFSFEQVDSFA